MGLTDKNLVLKAVFIRTFGRLCSLFLSLSVSALILSHERILTVPFHMVFFSTFTGLWSWLVRNVKGKREERERNERGERRFEDMTLFGGFISGEI